MIGKKDTPIKNDSSMEPQLEQDTTSFAESHSQDADRHRKIKHPISDK